MHVALLDEGSLLQPACRGRGSRDGLVAGEGLCSLIITPIDLQPLVLLMLVAVVVDWNPVLISFVLIIPIVDCKKHGDIARSAIPPCRGKLLQREGERVRMDGLAVEEGELPAILQATVRTFLTHINT
jgi:hypothetical protein